jgi:hypothetical protein
MESARIGEATSLNPRLISSHGIDILSGGVAVIFPPSVARSREKVHRMHYASPWRTNGRTSLEDLSMWSALFPGETV